MIVPEYVLTEDSNSGYEFFRELSKERNITCISANGKSNIISCLQKMERKKGTCNVRVTHILEQPEEYIDSKEYVSWERFFTSLLVSKTQGNPLWAYSKKKLPDMYLSSKILNAVKVQMKLIVWNS